MSTSNDFCRRAMAYLKVATTGDAPVALQDPNQPVFKDLGSGLLATYVVETGDSLTYIQQWHLNDAGISPEQLHAQAVQNLAEFAAQKSRVHGHGKIHVVLSGGKFEASMILVSQFWSEWYCQLAPNGFVVAFPARDLLAFADRGDPEAIAELREACAKAAGKVDHPLTSQLYTHIGNGWRPFD